MTVDQAAARRVERAGECMIRVRDEVGRAVVGQRAMLDRLLIGLLTGGHVLLEGLPGLAKTLAVSSLARALSLRFRRIQFTPALPPARLTRAPAKVQSALLEAMQEKQVTLGDDTHPLEEPFLVLATQNPVEQEGTYPLPEAQSDRFMLKVKVGYPERSDEKEILRRAGLSSMPELKSQATHAQVVEAREALSGVYV